MVDLNRSALGETIASVSVVAACVVVGFLSLIAGCYALSFAAAESHKAALIAFALSVFWGVGPAAVLVFWFSPRRTAAKSRRRLVEEATDCLLREIEDDTDEGKSVTRRGELMDRIHALASEALAHSGAR